MTNYEAPKVLLTNSGEGPFGNSGPSDPNAPEASVRWDNHNSGSHSDLYLDIIHLRNKYHLTATLTWNGKGRILAVGGFSGKYKTANFYEYEQKIVFTADLNGNGDENITFGFDNVVFNKRGDDDNVGDGYRGSYFEGQGVGYKGIASEFSIRIDAT